MVEETIQAIRETETAADVIVKEAGKKAGRFWKMRGRKQSR